jgi:hypothetical protein
VVSVLCHKAGEEKLRQILAEFSNEFGKQRVRSPSILTDTGRGAAMIGWWEGVLMPKKDTGVPKGDSEKAEAK